MIFATSWIVKTEASWWGEGRTMAVCVKKKYGTVKNIGSGLGAWEDISVRVSELLG